MRFVTAAAVAGTVGPGIAVATNTFAESSSAAQQLVDGQSTVAEDTTAVQQGMDAGQPIGRVVVLE